MSVEGERRRALDHLPRRTGAAGSKPVLSARAIEIYRGTRDDYTVFPFDKLVWANYFPSKGIQLHFASHTVWIAGHDLSALHEGLRDQTVRSVGPEDAGSGPCSPGVEAVYIKQVGKEGPSFVWPSESTLEAEQA